MNETADPAQMLREAARLLKPGGRLWLMSAAPTGSLGQTLLGRLGGLHFPEVAWMGRVAPDLSLEHVTRKGGVEFVKWRRE